MAKHIVTESQDPSVDIHKIIDDAMVKGDRSVSIFLGPYGTTINVNPYVEEKHYWLIDEKKCWPVCSNCGYEDSHRAGSTYCGGCGEQMHGLKHNIDIDSVINRMEAE